MSDKLPLSEVFLAHVKAPGGALSPSAALEEVLLGLVQAGSAAWPELPLPAEDFVRHLARHLPAAAAGTPEQVDIIKALQAINGRDLYLACGCARGLPAAIAAFDQAYLALVPALLGRIEAAPGFVEEIQQILRVKLLVAKEGPPDQAPKIGDYSGRGALLMWVRVAALRTAVSFRRRRAEQPARAADEVAALGVPAAPDPELSYIKAHHGAEFKEAFQAALGTLSSEQRNILRLSIVTGLSSDKIAALYRVNRSTVVRRLQASREAIWKETRRQLQKRLHLGPEEFESLARVVHSQLDVSLARLLTKTTE